MSTASFVSFVCIGGFVGVVAGFSTSLYIHEVLKEYPSVRVSNDLLDATVFGATVGGTLGVLAFITTCLAGEAKARILGAL